MNKKELEIAQKQMTIEDLLGFAIGVPEMRYFNKSSDKLLDEKIEVLTQIKQGKVIKDIPKFYGILEDLPKDEGESWD
jgi:hypothetical protein